MTLPTITLQCILRVYPYMHHWKWKHWHQITLFMSKELGKTIVERSYFENIYFKKRDDHSLRTYRKQKSYCSGFYKKKNKFFFNNLNLAFVFDNKVFLKTVKTLFSNIGNCDGNIKFTKLKKMKLFKMTIKLQKY